MTDLRVPIQRERGLNESRIRLHFFYPFAASIGMDAEFFSDLAKKRDNQAKKGLTKARHTDILKVQTISFSAL